MKITLLRNTKNEIELETDSLTIVEILRTYLNKDSNVIFAAWKREHPTKKPILLVKTKSKTAKKAVGDAVKEIEKDLEKIDSDFKKLK